MEKIKFQPLIAEFSDKSALYNQWYNDSEMKYGNLPSQAINSWMTEVVEPIVKAAFEQNSASEKIHEVVKALYLESLKLIGNGAAIRYKEEYKTAWLLMAEMPNLVLKFPVKTILLLNDVLSGFHTYAAEKVLEWCGLMSAASAEIKTIDDFKIVGRIYAWKCGLAHLRARSKTNFEDISENLRQIIGNTISLNKDTNHLFDNPWPNNDTKFRGVHGGFLGTKGFFEHPPKVAQIGEHTFVTDSKNNYALFADQFGNVLMPANTVDSVYILSNSKKSENLERLLQNESKEIDLNNISSVATTKDTLIYTLQNSYFLYLFSLKNG